ncbi:MAG: hypothetical protein J5441_01990 [Clostridia bacterium]|nr:hypothetical protein [Clostridia bacterium]
MDFRDIDDSIDEMWEMEQTERFSRSDPPRGGCPGCSYGFWKFVAIAIMVYWFIDLIFGK